MPLAGNNAKSSGPSLGLCPDAQLIFERVLPALGPHPGGDFRWRATAMIRSPRTCVAFGEVAEHDRTAEGRDADAECEGKV